MENKKNTAVIDYLKARRSELAITMEGNPPSEAELQEILTLAARVPDHGKLAPWRFIVYKNETRAKLGAKLQEIANGLEDDAQRLKYEKSIERFVSVPLVVAIISTAKSHEKIPIWEQELSGGAVAQNCLIAAQAYGYGAQWLTGWLAYDEVALKHLGVKDDEKLIGLMHIGRSNAAKHDRDRPDLTKLVTTL